MECIEGGFFGPLQPSYSLSVSSKHTYAARKVVYLAFASMLASIYTPCFWNHSTWNS